MMSSISRSARCSNLSGLGEDQTPHDESPLRKQSSSRSLVDEESPVNCAFEFSTENFSTMMLDPVDRLKDIFQDLIDYKLDAISARATAMKVSEKLHEDSPISEQLEAVNSIRTLAGRPTGRQGLLASLPLIRQLIDTLREDHSNELLTEVAAILQILVKTKQGSEVLVQELGVPSAISMLKEPSDVLCTTGLYLLNQMMWHMPEDVRPEVRACSGHIVMAEQLHEGRFTEPNWIVICVDAIRMVVYRSTEAKLMLLRTNVHDDLVRLLRTYHNHTKVAYNIARLMKVLGTCGEHKAKLVDSGAVEALTLLLQSDHEFVQLESLWTLRNISDRAYHLTNTRTLIQCLSELLASRDENISICVCGCLCNFTCRNTDNKGYLVETGGVARLCQLLNLNSERQEITEPICSTLRHVTHRSPHANAAIFEIRSNHALPTIATLLDQDVGRSALPLIKALLGLVRNLASDEKSREELKSHGVIRSLARVLTQAFVTIQTIRNEVAHHSISSTADCVEDTVVDGCIEGVHLDDMLGLCLITLQSIMKDEDSRNELVLTAGIGSCIVQLLYYPVETVQRDAVALLSRLAISKSGVEMIEQEGACPRLTEMVQSSNEHIAAYSAAVLHRITLDKPKEYRERLSLELRQALFDGGLLTEVQSKGNVISQDLLSYLDSTTPHHPVLRTVKQVSKSERCSMIR